MKRLLTLMLAAVLALSLMACGGGEPEAKTAFSVKNKDNFYEALANVISNNDELDGLTLDDEQVYESGDFVGVLNISEDDNGILQGVTVFVDADGPTERQYFKILNATWMALDDKLTYDEANGISDQLDDIWLFGGDPVVNNEIKYDANYQSNYVTFIAAANETTVN